MTNKSGRRVFLPAVFFLLSLPLGGEGLPSPREGAEKIRVAFPGQYRVNFYSVENDREGEGGQTAARYRMRQNLDVTFDENLKSSVRFQLNHANDSVTDGKDVKGDGVLLRHGYMDYRFAPGSRFRAGLVPVEEYHRDLFYSRGWGYNPFALEGFLERSGWELHGFAAQLDEGSETNGSDDILHYQADLVYKERDAATFTLSSSVVRIARSGIHRNLALRGDFTPNDATAFTLILAGSRTDRKILGSSKEAGGYALLAEWKKRLGRSRLGLLATHADGDEEGRGFLVPASFTGTNTYWGYTGVVTVMAQTDTGFAEDSVHVSNNGYGMSTIQGKLEYEPDPRTLLYLAAGWFGNTHAKERSATVATDMVAMAAHRLHPYLRLDLGIDYALLRDSLSGYAQGVVGGAGFNREERTRYKTALFGRLQLEF